MNEPLNFYRLLNMEDACPRRMVFTIKGIKGVNQYYRNKQIYLKSKVFEFLIEKFALQVDTTSFQKIDEEFTSRMEQEGVGELIQNFDVLITQNEIDITDINKKKLYMPDGFPVGISVFLKFGMIISKEWI